MSQQQPSQQPPKDAELQGEGNYDAARRYDKATTDFVKSGKVDEAAQAARPKDEQEAQELSRAEREGKSRSKGEDAVDPKSGT